MPKLTLDVEELAVETFEPAAAARPGREAAPDEPRTPFCSAVDLCPTRPC